MVLPVRIELTTSPLPRECSTTSPAQEPRRVEPRSCRFLFFRSHRTHREALHAANCGPKDHGLTELAVRGHWAPNVWAAPPLIAVRRLWVSFPISCPVSDDVMKNWSEWQDLNLRPPRPERKAHGRDIDFNMFFQCSGRISPFVPGH